MTREEVDKELKELRDSGLHHSSAEYKSKKAELEAQITEEAPKAELEAQPEEQAPIVQEEQVQKPSPKPQVKVEEEKSNTMEINPSKSYLFKLQKKSTGFWVLPRRDKVWDEKEQRIREIRYSQMEESPYVDEQDEDAPEARIAPRFKNGELLVSGKDKPLINYLLAHDANADKGNNIAPQNQKVLKHRYKLILTEDKASKERQFREQVRKAGNLIADADVRKLEDFMRSHFRFIQQEFNEDELVSKAYEKAGRYPELFLNDFNNPKHAIKATVQRGMAGGMFSVKNGLVKSKNGATILKYDPSGKYDEALTSWIMKGTQEAKDFYEILDNNT